MRFDPVDEYNPVGPMGQPVQEQGNPVHLTHRFHLHGGPHRHTHALLGDSPGSQDLLLAFGHGAAVRTHGRSNKGIIAGLFQFTGHGPDNSGQVGNTPAADGHGHAGALGQTQMVLDAHPFPVHFRQNIHGRRDIKTLPNHPHLGQS